MVPNVRRNSENVNLCNVSSFIVRKHINNKLHLQVVTNHKISFCENGKYFFQICWLEFTPVW